MYALVVLGCLFQSFQYGTRGLHNNKLFAISGVIYSLVYCLGCYLLVARLQVGYQGLLYAMLAATCVASLFPVSYTHLDVYKRQLRNMGADARLVNYDPAPWQQRNQSSLRKSKPFRAARVCQQRLMGAAPYVSDEKDAAFHAFASKYIRETEPVSLFEDFSILNSHFDAFVCGLSLIHI